MVRRSGAGCRRGRARRGEWALAADPRHVPTLVRRAELQRRRPASDRRLVDTLVLLASEPVQTHARGGEIAAGALADEALALDLLARLGDRAAHLLAHGARATGRFAAADVAAYAVDEAVRLHVSAGTPERTGRATAMLLDAARFRVSDERRHGWLRRAAELTETTLANRSGAIRIWRPLHEQAPEDAPAGEALARLYEAEGRFADAVSLRVAELAGSQEAERRLALRLEIVRLSGLVERQGDAPEVLRASLRERPGHGPTLRKLTDVLVAKGRQASWRTGGGTGADPRRGRRRGRRRGAVGGRGASGRGRTRRHRPRPRRLGKRRTGSIPAPRQNNLCQRDD